MLKYSRWSFYRMLLGELLQLKENMTFVGKEDEGMEDGGGLSASLQKGILHDRCNSWKSIQI